MAENKKKKWAESECEDWGGYMAAKKAKLEEQFQEAAAHDFKDSTNIFSGVAIFVNGYTNPNSDELKRLMMAHGGIYHHYLRSQKTTHMIATNLPYSKIVEYRKAKNPLPLCKPDWIVDSIKAGKLLDYRKYLLYSQSTKDQPQLFAQIQDKKNDMTPSIQNSTKNSEFLTDFYNNSRLHHIATMGATFKDYINEIRSKSDNKFSGLEALKKKSSVVDHNDESDDENLYNNASAKSSEPVIMHIDMDCFFVSVGLRSHPELKGLPVAVAHAKGNKQSNANNPDDYGSMSEIASCSYEARKLGVKNGMFLGQALKLCPNLKTIKYDFEGYKDVSFTLYDTVASYTLDIEAVSCDEMYVDCTTVLQESKLRVLEFAKILRDQIKEKTGCPVSTGFGKNKLLARLATKKAKPDGQCHLKGDDILSFIRTLQVRDLPGVGYSTSHKLKEMGVKTCADLEKIELHVLQNEFGKKTGLQLHEMCRGIDNCKLNLEHVRKSVSAEVNYGIRFENTNEAKEFLEKLCVEVSERLQKSKSKGRCINLKVMVRSKEAPVETKKFMGHGMCDVFNKTKNLIAATDDPVIITREIWTLWNQIIQSPEDARGIGIHISKLESVNFKSNETNILNFFKKQINQQESEKNKKSCLSDFNNRQNQKIMTNPSDNFAKIKSFVNKADNKEESSIHKNNKNYKQTTQSSFFKEVKPTSRSGKAKLPDIKEIDMKVLVELPEDIRNEILNEYKNVDNEEENKSCEQRPSNNNHLVNRIRSPAISDGDLSFSQVDPEFLAALPNEVKNEVKLYCDAKKKEKDNVKANKPSLMGWNMFKSDKKVNKNLKSKNSKLNKIVKCNDKKTVKANVISLVNENPKSDVNTVVKINACAKNEKTKDSFKINHTLKCKESDHSQILSNLVEHFLNLPISQVRQQIETWINNSDSVNDVDFLSLTTYLGTLPKRRRLEDLHILLKCLYRCIVKSESCIWHDTYRKTLEHIQTRMRLEYNNNNLMIPCKIDCDNCIHN